MTRIVCVGELLVDMIGKESGDLTETQRFVKRAGGAPANVAVAASRLGEDVDMVATVGPGELGDFLVEKMDQENVAIGDIRRAEQKTTLAFAALDEDAEPHFSFYRGADRHITEEQFEFNLWDDAIVHLGSLPWTNQRSRENLMEFLRETEATVSFDPNLREDLLDDEYTDFLSDLLNRVDILLAAEHEIEFFGPDLVGQVDEVVISRGSDGAKLIADETYEVQPPEVDVKDTTGAGDALAGAYLAYRSDGKKVALDKAVKAAAVSTEKKGAMKSLPQGSDLA